MVSKATVIVVRYSACMTLFILVGTTGVANVSVLNNNKRE